MGRVGDGRVVQGKEHVHWRGGWLTWDAGDMGRGEGKVQSEMEWYNMFKKYVPYFQIKSERK